MDLRFYLDAETGEPHFYQHGVTEEEVAEVLRRPGEDRPGREGSRVAIGKTAGGRYLRVIYVPDPEPESAFVITCAPQEMHPPDSEDSTAAGSGDSGDAERCFSARSDHSYYPAPNLRDK